VVAVGPARELVSQLANLGELTVRDGKRGHPAAEAEVELLGETAEV
jgi:hypothetical protein